MPRFNRLGVTLLALFLVVVVAAVWFMRPTPQPAAPSPTATAAVTPAAPTAPPSTPTTAGADAPDDPATDPVTPEADPSAGDVRAFQIDPTQSEARFIVDEVLFGNPNTVIGSTDEVSGTIDVDLADPTRTTVEPIQINARSLATDNRFRNRSLTRLILQSNQDAYQYITFTPTQIDGLPAAAAVGDAMNLDVSGDLQIRDIVQPVTFAVTVTATSDTQLTGTAVATVQRADFDLNIPNVEGVADVTQDVRLEFDFVAVVEE